MSTEISIPSPFSATIVALSADVARAAEQAADSIHTLMDALPDRRIATAEQAADAAACYQRAQKLEKTIEAARKEAKAPVLDLGKKLDAAAESATAPLLASRQELGIVIADWQKREAARVAAERAEAARIAAENRAAAEEAARAARVAAQPEPIVIPYTPPPVVAPAPKSVVKTVTVTVLEITDCAAIPYTVTLPTGVVASLYAVDEAAVKAALVAGATVPGATLRTEERVQAVGR